MLVRDAAGFERVRLDLLSNKIRDKIIKGKDKVSDAQIKDFYDKNKERFAQPERRDLRIILTKSPSRAAPQSYSSASKPSGVHSSSRRSAASVTRSSKRI